VDSNKEETETSL